MKANKYFNFFLVLFSLFLAVAFTADFPMKTTRSTGRALSVSTSANLSAHQASNTVAVHGLGTMSGESTENWVSSSGAGIATSAFLANLGIPNHHLVTITATGAMGLASAPFQPSRILDIVGTTNFPVQFIGASGSGIIFGSYNSTFSGFWPYGVVPATNNYGFLLAPAGGTSFNTPSGQIMYFCTNNVTKMQLESNGCLSMLSNGMVATTTQQAGVEFLVFGDTKTDTLRIATTTLHPMSGLTVASGVYIDGAATFTDQIYTTATSATRNNLGINFHDKIVMDTNGNASFPGNVQVASGVNVTGISTFTDTVTFSGTASAVKILGNPANPTVSDGGKCGLDIWNNNLMLGANDVSNSRANNIAKYGTILVPAFSNAEQPFIAMYNYSLSAANSVVNIGGGDVGAFNSATILCFRTNVTATTLGAAPVRGTVTANGRWILGTSTTTLATGGINLATDTYIQANATVTGNLDIQGAQLIATSTQYAGCVSTIEGSQYVSGDLYSLSVIDHTPCPESEQEAMDMVFSMEPIPGTGQLDHAKLHAKAKGHKTVMQTTGRKLLAPFEDKAQDADGNWTVKTIEYKEVDEVLPTQIPDGRNLSMVVSAQAMAIKNLERRLKALESKQ